PQIVFANNEDDAIDVTKRVLEHEQLQLAVMAAVPEAALGETSTIANAPPDSIALSKYFWKTSLLYRSVSGCCSQMSGSLAIGSILYASE
ncbi:MAG: hypothetical protein ACXV5L_05515, partial [Thermoanaerobaculia bacterium]